MIHTVTVNPALDITYRIPAIKVDDTIRATEVLRAAGGKGVNVSRVAARLGHPTVAMGFAGGRAGDEMTELLTREGVRTWFVRQSEQTRTNAILHDEENHQIRVSGPGCRVTAEMVKELEESIFDLRVPDFLQISGSLLEGMPKDFYSKIIARAFSEGIKVAVDADKDELKDAVAAGAYLIKPNQFELERLTGLKADSMDRAIDSAQRALEMGVGVVLASFGGEGALLVTAVGAWRGVPPPVKVDSAVGSGDSMLAGALVALSEGREWPEVLRLGIACGTATATTPGTELCHKPTIEAILPQVLVERLE